MKKIILLGPPGAGKGTISELIVKHQKISHISVGDILRQNISQKTKLGVLANKYISKGNLLPDEIVIDLVRERLSKDDCINNYLLDGYPRTIEQAKALDSISRPNFIFNLSVSSDIIINRLIGRRICNSCKTIYNINNLDGENCPKCGKLLTIRKDDNEEVVKNRLEVYKNETSLLVKYYEQNKQLINIDASKKPYEIYKIIEEYLNASYNKN